MNPRPRRHGTCQQVIGRIIFLTVGVLAEAQLGARLSTRVRGAWIVRSLAIALGFVGLHILMVTLNWSLDKALSLSRLTYGEKKLHHL